MAEDNRAMNDWIRQRGRRARGRGETGGQPRPETVVTSGGGSMAGDPGLDAAYGPESVDWIRQARRLKFLRGHEPLE